MKLRAYDFLFRLYPKEHRELFGEEMAAVLRQAAQERRREGVWPYTRFTLCEVAGLVAAATALWAAKLAERRQPEAEAGIWFSTTSSVAETERLIQRSIDCMVNAIATHQFAKARFYSDEERKLRARLQELRGE
jgi:hypothetical protein